ncbi:kinase-like protein [Aspergillus steynii IBT 23096]|uniref:Kinase-like protein n=1 Tax=Aspergillus steynii IBT 23096 TaxID=1392250 RepID=A0A2I2G7H1_9EURO|nr:kinase-like protein [Aspergillus steynii IBT 23096]PLB48825.1 kinase-like protein [Aspergillus steynii IBT 23096]
MLQDLLTGPRTELISHHGPVRLTPSMLPEASNFDAKDSSFFNNWSELPSPSQVREMAKAQWASGTSLDKRKSILYGGRHMRPPPALFEDMGLVVKWGVEVALAEARSAYAVHRLMKGRVPVPEVYGWRIDGEEKFIYMQYVRGQPLEKAWDSLERLERETICHQLRTAIDNLRQLEQDPSDRFIGSIMRSPFYDRIWPANFRPEAGPFTSVHEFHEWFTFLGRRPMADPYSVPIEHFRYGLPDNSSIRFTHGDLHRSNVVISPSQPYRVLAIVDWEQSGWLPEYWEARKAQFTVDSQEWSEEYLPMILDQYESTAEPWEWYMSALGC